MSTGDSFAVQASGNTDVGRVRSSNQDSFLCDHGRRLYIIADGMGGHAGGEVASSLAVQNIRAYLDRQLPTVPMTSTSDLAAVASVLSDAINFASTKIYERALEEPSLRGMGTTATVAKVFDRHLVVGHVGDSRLYLIRCGYVYQLTTDHSLVSEQLRAGVISKEDAANHQFRNVITRSVGYQEQEDVDTVIVELEPDDTILMCSDGLHGAVGEMTLENYCQKFGILAVDHLIAEANHRGGEDNISVIVLTIKV